MKTYKTILFTFLIIFLSNITVSQVYWVEIASPTQKNLIKSHFVDSLYGWVIGDSGTVLRTTNAGTNWEAQSSGVVSSELKDLTFISRNTGWIISVDSNFRSFILHTTNSGVNWYKSYYPDTTAVLSTIFFTDSNTGYVSGFNGRIYKTTNNSISWSECYIDTTSCLYLFPKNDINFINSQTGYSCGGVLDLQGTFIKTTNAGGSWFSMCVAAEPLHMIKYLGNNRIAMMGGDYDLGSILAVSTNAGSNWSYEQTGCYGNATAFAFRTPSEVWAALSFYGTFAVNLDSMKPGSTWQCINAPGNTAIYAIEFLSPNIGYCFGDHGKIYKYNQNIIGIQNTQNNNFPSNSILYQNYPNPFNPETNIRYYISEPSDVTLKLFDVNGKEVLSMNQGYKVSGEYNLSVNLGELPSAVYYYRLITQNQTITKKMVLIK